ncbi:hypothetical protein LWI29_020085 [Acer saccharum]|uniref:NAD(P)-binding domain-containing protein n=1 Tax=Acer saccharum TaxID=4024 RepID=A0AA39VGB8_ACESA|nr:hypothetical protein LWI29_020085 [Acer saccharum]
MVAAQVCQSQLVGRSEDSLIGVPVHSSRVGVVPVSSEGPSSILDVSAGAVVSISSATSMVGQGSKVNRDSVSPLVSFAQPIVSSVVSVDELDDRVKADVTEGSEKLAQVGDDSEAVYTYQLRFSQWSCNGANSQSSLHLPKCLWPHLSSKASEQYIRKSGINYTIVRPGGLKNEPPTGNVVMEPEDTLYEGSISRDQVAEVAVEALIHSESYYKVVEIVSRPDAPKHSYEDLFGSIKQR